MYFIANQYISERTINVSIAPRTADMKIDELLPKEMADLDREIVNAILKYAL